MSDVTCPGCGELVAAGTCCPTCGAQIAAALQPTERLPASDSLPHAAAPTGDEPTQVLPAPAAVDVAVDQNASTAPEPTSAATTLQPGRILNGRYRIERLLGQGGMGAVYLARDANLADRACAVKELSDSAPIGQGAAEALLQFAQEAEVLAGLNHPGIPQVYDRFSAHGRYYLVMEYVAGLNLGQLLRLYERDHGQPLPEAEVVRWALQLCDVLEYLHRHNPPVIHRDVKPDNLILLREGRVKLVDFGIARPITRGRETAVGTAGYAPPEQYQGQTSPQSDLYAMGACLHHLITGADPQARGPFDFPMLSRFKPDVNPVLQHLVAELLALNPLDRPATVSSVRAELRAAYPAVDPDRPQGIDPAVAAILTREFNGLAADPAGGAAGESSRVCPVCGALHEEADNQCRQCGVTFRGPAPELQVAGGQGPLTFPLVAGCWTRRSVERVALVDEAGHMATAYLLGIITGSHGRYAIVTHGAGVAEAYLLAGDAKLQTIPADQQALVREVAERYRAEFSPAVPEEEGRPHPASEAMAWVAAVVTALVVIGVWLLSLRS